MKETTLKPFKICCLGKKTEIKVFYLHSILGKLLGALRQDLWTGNMAQQVKVLATKPDDLSSIPEFTWLGGEPASKALP